MASPSQIDPTLTLALESQTRALLSELDKRLQLLDSKWESRVSTLESRATEAAQSLSEFSGTLRADVEAHLTAADASTDAKIGQIEADLGYRVAALESTAGIYEFWRPRVDASLDDLHSSVDWLRSEVSKMEIQWSRGARADGFHMPGVLGAHGSAPGRSSVAGDVADGPRFGHRNDSHHRDSGPWHPGADARYPVTGMHNPYASPSFTFPQPGSVGFNEPDPRGWSPRQLGGLPKLNFPSFDGSNPKLWQSKCEKYFHMYATEASMWVEVATMHFVGVADRWLQSVEPRLPSMSWRQFCQSINDRFGREQHELVIRKLFHIRQTSTVQDYVDRFSELIDLLVTYEHTTDPLYYTMKFIDGLRDDIKSVILVQRPGDLDTACALALLQEEAETSRRRESGRVDHAHSTRAVFQQGQPSRWGKQLGSSKSAAATPPASADSKVASLRAYRRARGLCQFCAEKWSKGHKCANTIQLHAVQELWEMFSSEPQESEGEFEDSAETFMVLLSTEAISPKKAPSRSFRLQGQLQDENMLILLDSGSSHCFLNTSRTSSLSGFVSLETPLAVTVANGGILHCPLELPNATWSVQELEFCTTFKVIPLPYYDIILGMDWLEQFSPMMVDWKHKWLSIPHSGQTVILQGYEPLVPVGTILEVWPVSELQDTSAELHCVVDMSLPQPITYLLQRYQDLFQPPTTLPPSRSCDHSITLIDGARPVSIRPYRFSPAMKDEIESQVTEMLQSGLIQHSTSAFSSPVLLVKKKDNTWRFCVDYRHLNALTVKAKYPVPVIDELLDELFGASWFSILDLRAGFHQILLKDGEAHKTAFQTHLGHYEFRVMAFGLTGAPGTFQKAMNHTLAPLLRKCALVFFDDILVYSASLAEHISHLEQVFDLLSADAWKVKFSKCKFAQQQVSYLGHVVSSKGVSTDPVKIEAIAHWPEPSCVKELRSFLGLAGYYRKFIRHFGVICQPLTALLKKGVLYIWTSDHACAFQTLKTALTQAPVLSLPNFTAPFFLETDASAVGVGAVLMQHGHPLAFLSKALGPKSRGLSTYEKEYLAVILAVQQWRYYLQHHEFVILTDHKSLTQLNEQRLHTPWQHKVFTKLLGLQYKIQYRPGSENRVADALSRRATADCQAISVSVPQWLLDVQASYTLDSDAQSLLAKLSLDPNAVPHYTLQNGLLKYKGRIWVGSDDQLKHRILSALHCSPVGGHSGIPVTYCRVKQLFAWSKLKQSVQDFVKNCQICLQAKPDRSAYPGKLQPLPIPTTAWHTISLDFVEGLPRSGSADCILVVVDKFTKFAHFLPLSHPYTATSVAQLFLSQVYRLHGFPLAVISDRDPIFTSQFWQQLFKLAGFQGPGNVTTPPATDPSPGETLKPDLVEKQVGRKRRANEGYAGNENYSESLRNSPFPAILFFPKLSPLLLLSKLQSEVLKDAISQIVQDAKKNRKFTETVELQISLKNYDPQKDKRFSGSMKLPHIPHPKMKVCMLGDAQHVEEAEKMGLDYMDVEALKKMNKNKKLVKKLAEKYHAFLASETIIKQIPRLHGPGLNKAGKFPTLVTHQESLESKVNETKATVKFQLKKVLCMGVVVGNLSMEEKQIQQNIQMSVNFLVSLLKKNWQNVRCLYIKSTMGKPCRVF
eukprot:XP_020393779.1 uncharacterized protein LOC103628713 [Zea mays]